MTYYILIDGNYYVSHEKDEVMLSTDPLDGWSTRFRSMAEALQERLLRHLGSTMVRVTIHEVP